MAKRIKGALVIILVIVLSCLLLIGCLFALEVKGDRINQSNLENKTDNNFQLSADKEIILEGDTTDMATKWNEAIVYSKSNGGANVNVVLKNDWIATSTGESTTFGSYADSFISGAILISEGATITLDLQGHTIDRKLTKPTSNGLVLFVEGGTLTIKDSSYNDSDLLNIYERLKYKPFEKIMATIRSELNIGNITGGAAASTGGGIHLINGGKLNFESGMIADNIYAPTGGGIYAYPTCVVNISGGLIADNKSATNGGGVFINGGELNITGGLIIGNTAKSFGGGIYGRANAVINIENGIIANNYAEVRGGGINVEGGTLNLNDGIIARNEANIDAGGVYVAKDTTIAGVFNMNGGEISNNKSNFGGGVYLYNEAQAVINNGIIKENISYGNSAGMIIYSGSICTINNVQIIDNKVYRNIENSYSGGAGCMVAVSSQLIFNGGLIANNKIVEDNTSSQVNGGGILLANSSTTQPVVLTVNGGTITGNSALHYGGGIYDATGVSEINISGNAQIYGNTANGEESDIHINKGRSININGKLGDTAHIGIRLAGNYGEEVFTNGYSTYNTEKPSAYFFSSNERGKIASINNVEVKLVQTINTDTYEFVYMEEKNGKTYRHKYTDNELIHGVNDYKCNVGGNYILGNVMPYTSVNEFVGNLNIDTRKIKVYNSNGYLIYDKGGVASGLNSNILDNKYNLSVGTGWVLEVIDSTNKVVDSIKISVLGDISGDGRVNSVDITNMRSLVGNTEKYNKLTEAQKLASLVDNKGSISVVDIEILKAYINGDIDLRNYY